MKKNFEEFFFWRALALVSLAEVESSRTHFEVLGLGLGLEASSPRKLACPRLEDSTIFWNVKILWSAWKIFWKAFFSGDRLKNFCEDLFFFFFLESTCALCPWSLALASSIPVLGLESVCPRKGYPWPWPRIFLCPWPWPRALCPRLHLWSLVLGLEHSCPWPWEGLSSEGLSLAEVESRTQGSRPRPRTQKKSKAKDSLFEDRTSRGQGQERSRPRPRTKDTGASVLRKKVFKNFFQAISNLLAYPEFMIGGGLNHKSHAMTSSKFFQRGSFCLTKIS